MRWLRAWRGGGGGGGICSSMDGDIEYVRREVEERGIDLSVAATIFIRDGDGTMDEYTVTPLQVRVAAASLATRGK